MLGKHLRRLCKFNRFIFADKKRETKAQFTSSTVCGRDNLKNKLSTNVENRKKKKEN